MLELDDPRVDEDVGDPGRVLERDDVRDREEQHDHHDRVDHESPATDVRKAHAAIGDQHERRRGRPDQQRHRTQRSRARQAQQQHEHEQRGHRGRRRPRRLQALEQPPAPAPQHPPERARRQSGPHQHADEQALDPRPPRQPAREMDHNQRRGEQRRERRRERRQPAAARPGRDRVRDPRPDDQRQRQDDEEGDQVDGGLDRLVLLVDQSGVRAVRRDVRVDHEQQRGDQHECCGDRERRGQHQRRPEPAGRRHRGAVCPRRRGVGSRQAHGHDFEYTLTSVSTNPSYVRLAHRA